MSGRVNGGGGSTVWCSCAGLVASNPGLGKLLFAALFPVCLMLVLLTGSDLFTGNTMKMPIAVLEGKANVGDLLRNWLLSFTGNFVGSLLIVGLAAASGVLDGSAFAAKTAAAKCSLTWTQAFVRGVIANWLVCAAVWCAGAASTLPGKVMAIWPPISAFVAMGMEHSVSTWQCFLSCVHSLSSQLAIHISEHEESEHFLAHKLIVSAVACLPAAGW